MSKLGENLNNGELYEVGRIGERLISVRACRFIPVPGENKKTHSRLPTWGSDTSNQTDSVDWAKDFELDDENLMVDNTNNKTLQRCQIIDTIEMKTQSN